MDNLIKNPKFRELLKVIITASAASKVRLLNYPVSKNRRKKATKRNKLLFEICALEIYEKFVYKHSKTIEYVKN